MSAQSVGASAVGVSQPAIKGVPAPARNAPTTPGRATVTQAADSVTISDDAKIAAANRGTTHSVASASPALGQVSASSEASKAARSAVVRTSTGRAAAPQRTTNSYVIAFGQRWRAAATVASAKSWRRSAFRKPRSNRLPWR